MHKTLSGLNRSRSRRTYGHLTFATPFRTRLEARSALERDSEEAVWKWLGQDSTTKTLRIHVRNTLEIWLVGQLESSQEGLLTHGVVTWRCYFPLLSLLHISSSRYSPESVCAGVSETKCINTAISPQNNVAKQNKSLLSLGCNT